MNISRRQLLAGAGMASVPLLLAGCGFVPSSSAPSSGKRTLSFTTWGTDAEVIGFKNLIASFEKKNPGAKIQLNLVPYEQMFTDIDAQLQTGNPPDIWRGTYANIGSYAGAGQLLDLTKHLPAGFADRFTDQAWASVQQHGRTFGVPHHTDTSALLYRKSILADAGITNIPTAIDDAWTWEEFLGVAKTLRAKLPDAKYPFGYNWQGASVSRWLSLVYQADGRFLSKDLTRSAIDSAQGRKAIDFSRSFFPNRYVPANDTPKSTTYAADSFYNGTTAMVFSGAFAVPDAQAALKDDWAATFHLRHDRQGGDFGGNPLMASSTAADKADLVTEFFDHVTQADQMRDFCSRAFLLPTRKDLIDSGISFATRPDVTAAFLGQASVIKAVDTQQVTTPGMPKITTALKQELETGFVGKRSTSATAAALSTAITAAVARS